MADYLRAHRLASTAGLAALLALAGWAFASTTLPIPQLLSGGSQPVLFQLLLTTLAAPVVVAAFPEETLRLENASRRRLWVYDVVTLVAVLGPVLLVSAVAPLLGDGTHTDELARNTALFVGLALGVYAAFGQTAALVVPCVYFLAVATAGGLPYGGYRSWAFPAADANPSNSTVAAVVLLVGLLVFAVRQRRPARPRSGKMRVPITPSGTSAVGADASRASG
ncbi:hypothetical protein [Frankia sp. R43]|uniref:hypothetical protein n=1 Tax=Frankia sp. R43 TaxID=269536 RepID=UPI0006C9E6F7|nr:hypothetical protein [Frankia sp. R43]